MFIIMLLVGCTINVANAQRIVGELESNSDFNGPMAPSRESSGNSTNSSNSKDSEEKEVPVDVKSWTIDAIYGNITPVVVDTLMHQFQNKALGEGFKGEYNTLSNLGSPRINRIFMDRKPSEDFLFLNPFDFFYVKSDEFRYFNTKCPYVNAEYKLCGSKQTGFDDLTVFYTNNAGKRINFGGKFNYLYGNGYYDNQNTAFMDGSGWFSYLGDKYTLHLQYTHDYLKMAENGGIVDDKYITDPESFSRSFTSNDIPTVLSKTYMRQEHNIVHLNHKYNIGFYKTEQVDSDSIDVFVPVTSIFHTLHFSTSRRKYNSSVNPVHFHTIQYLPGDSTDDRTNSLYLKNIFGLSLREGFNKWAAAGLNAYLGIENKRYELSDTLGTGRLYNHTYNENNILIGGQILRTQGKLLHFNLNGELTLSGENSGDYHVYGQGELNVPFRLFHLATDTMQIKVRANISNATPNFYFRHFHARNAWWDNDFDKEFRSRIEGEFALPHTHTHIIAGIENVKNYLYFQNSGVPYSSGTESGFTHHATAMQSDKNVQIYRITLRQNFVWKILHFDNDITFQHTSEDAVIPLPTFSTYHNLYITGQLVKNVLTAELGADLKFFTKYNAPDYSPVITQYINQNPLNLKEIGGYPLVSIYATFSLKQLRAYIQYYHLNQSSGAYFWAPGYPMDPSSIRFGISWNFYD